MTQKITTSDDVLDYYRQQSAFTKAGAHASLYDDLPDDIPRLCQALQNTILHMFWIGEETYGITYEQLKGAGREMCVEFSYSSAEERLRNIMELDPRPLIEPREPSLRSGGCCRDYALMLVSILRHRGIPARVRTGVARYFNPGGYLEDHYICESWNADDGRWRQTDPQIDDVQRKVVGLEMDMTDLPADQFLTGWQTYKEVQSGRVAPTDLGFPPVNVGLTYGLNKLFADIVGVTGHEMPVHAWWGIGDPRSAEEPGDKALIERMVEVLQGIDANDPVALKEALHLTSTHARLKMPDGYTVETYKAEFC